jgi:hypothetical protein
MFISSIKLRDLSLGNMIKDSLHKGQDHKAFPMVDAEIVLLCLLSAEGNQ